MPELLSLHDLPCDSSGVRLDTGAIELIVILHKKTLEKVLEASDSRETREERRREKLIMGLSN